MTFIPSEMRGGMWYTGDRCEECKAKIYTNGHTCWCSNQCFQNRRKIRK